MNKLIAISLALVILLGNLGLSVSTHLCCGERVETALSWNPAGVDCGMNEAAEEDTDACPIHNDSGYFDQKPCCETESFLLAVDEEFETDTELLLPLLADGFCHDFPVLPEPVIGVALTTTQLANPPPLPARQRRAKLQQYLI